MLFSLSIPMLVSRYVFWVVIGIVSIGLISFLVQLKFLKGMFNVCWNTQLKFCLELLMVLVMS